MARLLNSRMKEWGLRMNGTSQKMTFDAQANLGNIKLQAFTHSVWIKVSTPPSSYGQIIRWRTNGNSISIASTGYISAGITNSAGLSTGATGKKYCIDSQWHFIAYTWDGTTVNLYIDGVLDTTATGAKTVDYPNTDSFVLGADGSSGSGFYNGSMKDFRVYGSVLTSAQIKGMYEQGANMAFGSPVMWIKMDEGTGTTCADSGSSGYTGTIVGRTTTGATPTTMWVIDPVRPRRRITTNQLSSIGFNGTTSNISIGDNSALNMGTGDFTIEAKVFINKIGTAQFFVDKHDLTPTIKGWQLFFNDTTTSALNKILIWIQNSDYATASSNVRISQGRWYHIIASVTRNDQTAFKLFVNGVLDNTYVNNVGYSSTTGTLTNTVAMLIGKRSDGLFLQGGVHDVRLYNRALTDDECLSRYYTEENITSGRIGWWKMDETTGTSIADSQGSNTGTLTAGTFSNNTMS